eukprot:TRINITY_DN9206_c0_g1_i2.p1 TRINITY_DN9206_c0_g1~~TRINITY_DN9206_c0_g1_i2.p1  ORF type:complete len:398 (+),score=81.97 TRINITY_DN9206_c0_g1_i2:66-1196(+)
MENRGWGVRRTSPGIRMPVANPCSSVLPPDVLRPRVQSLETLPRREAGALQGWQRLTGRPRVQSDHGSGALHSVQVLPGRTSWQAPIDRARVVTLSPSPTRCSATPAVSSRCHVQRRVASPRLLASPGHRLESSPLQADEPKAMEGEISIDEQRRMENCESSSGFGCLDAGARSPVSSQEVPIAGAAAEGQPEPKPLQASPKAVPPAESGDPWEECEDLAEADLLEWMMHFARLREDAALGSETPARRLQLRGWGSEGPCGSSCEDFSSDPDNRLSSRPSCSTNCSVSGASAFSQAATTVVNTAESLSALADQVAGQVASWLPGEGTAASTSRPVLRGWGVPETLKLDTGRETLELATAVQPLERSALEGRLPMTH